MKLSIPSMEERGRGGYMRKEVKRKGERVERGHGERGVEEKSRKEGGKEIFSLRDEQEKEGERKGGAGEEK